MEFNLDTNQLRGFIKAVGNTSAFIKTKPSNPIEQCLYIKAEKDPTGGGDDKINVTCLESSHHTMTHSLKATVVEEGEVFINSDRINKMCKASRVEELTVKLEGSNLTFIYPKNELVNLGSIKEAIHYDQSGFSTSVLFNSRVLFSTVTAEDLFLPYILRTTYASCKKYKNILLSSDGGTLNVYCQFSESGFLTFTYNLTHPTNPFKMWVNNEHFSNLLSLGDSLEMQYVMYANVGAIRLQSEDNLIAVMGENYNSQERKAVQHVLDQQVVGKCVVNHANLIKAIESQSYKSGVEDTLTLLINDEGNLVINNSSSYTTASTLSALTGGSFDNIKMSIKPFLLGLKSIGSNKHKCSAFQLTDIVLQIREVPLDNGTSVKALTFKPSENLEVEVEAILFEPLVN